MCGPESLKLPYLYHHVLPAQRDRERKGGVCGERKGGKERGGGAANVGEQQLFTRTV